ncbi:flavin-binding monooxygenase-like family protein [Daedaleopsis nitida]|nr:flavin-binding monooxygenase-like family protein [Daedaleopsis nitida]
MSSVPPALAVPDPELQQKYVEERTKRLRAEGASQFVRLSHSAQLKHLQEDPWADHAALNAQPPAIVDNDDVRFLILGAGFGGLLFAVRLVQAGFPAASIRFVDDAGGFGGTWYWNRYPGLMCDVESYIYMPLLEETGYMPRRRYAHGSELRAHAERIARTWGLHDKALFRTRYTRAAWSDDTKRWTVALTETRGRGSVQHAPETRALTVTAQFVFAASGTLNSPQVPKIPGLDSFGGTLFHTSRWDYTATGGGPDDWALPLLASKRVGVIGTGATAVQIVPVLARCSRQLTVFQRTPSSVDQRGQRDTDPAEWTTKIAAAKGWQRARQENFNHFLMLPPNRMPREAREDGDLVSDAWTAATAYRALVGGETEDGSLVGLEQIPVHVASLQAADLERAERVRRRADEVVVDKATAGKLKAYYPVWCKRPTFHDEYLPSFNRPNVELVDTDGRGVERMTETGVVANGTEYPVDVLVLATGYVSPGTGSGSPAAGACIDLLGRGGRSMDAKWVEEGAGTLHGMATNGFPNLFFPGPSQAAVTANFTFALDTMARHVAQVVAEAASRAEDGWSNRLTVEVTKEAEEAWSLQTLMRAGWFAAIPGCTPGYINNEGERDQVQDTVQQMKAARAAPWGEGIRAFTEVIDAWRKEGGLKGLDISVD